MYIFELIQKIKKEGLFKKKPKEDNSAKYPVCDHVFVPVDSTKKVLACIKCGVITKAKKEPKMPE